MDFAEIFHNMISGFLWFTAGFATGTVTSMSVSKLIRRGR